jgi:hypothetical protein
MNSKVRRTSRPTLEALEDRLVPSWDIITHKAGVAAAVLTAAQPAPALSSFQWGVGRGISNAAVLTAGEPAATSPTEPPEVDVILRRVVGAAQPAAPQPVAGLTMPEGPTTAVTAVSASYLKYTFID